MYVLSRSIMSLHPRTYLLRLSPSFHEVIQNILLKLNTLPCPEKSLQFFQEFLVWCVSQHDYMGLKSRPDHQTVYRKISTSTVPSNGFLAFQICRGCLLRIRIASCIKI